MRIELICIAAALILAGVARADMPLGFYTALNNQEPTDILCVKNYQTGATVTEDYSHIEQLKRDTQVSTRTYASDCNQPTAGQGSLEASINSNVIGDAHIGWVSVDPHADSKGHHQVLGRSVEDLTGVFSVEKFIQLWSNSTPGEISVDWMPCV